MKKDEVEINAVYAAKVSGKLAPVRILSVGNFNANGWNGRNVTTGKKVFIKSAGRLRFKLVFHDGQWRKCVPAIVDARLNRKPQEELAKCAHQYEEQPGEPARDVCIHCGDVRY